jgi:hypothetical protein
MVRGDLSRVAVVAYQPMFAFFGELGLDYMFDACRKSVCIVSDHPALAVAAGLTGDAWFGQVPFDTKEYPCYGSSTQLWPVFTIIYLLCKPLV